jgi:hypothetical protein
MTPPEPAAAQTRATWARIDQVRVNKWVAAQIVNYPPDRCFGCRRPIIFGAKWVELVNDNDRARFHFACAPVWRARQEVLARRAMGLDRDERP